MAKKSIPLPKEGYQQEAEALGISVDVLKVNDHRRVDDSDKLIYHYCSADTFLTIMSRKTLRFTDSTCLNDGEELIWAHRSFEKVLSDIRDRDNIPDEVPAISKKFMDSFWEAWISASSSHRHFLSCFSLNGDSLSQWRSYADDGQGFSIGFRVNDIHVAARFIEVAYDPDVQRREIINQICEMYRIFKGDVNYLDTQVYHDAAYLYSVACAYKNPAFADEKEVRASHIVGVDEITGKKRLKSLGGNIGSEVMQEGEIEYRVDKGKLIPYIDLEFQGDGPCPVREIWMGPRCATTVDDLELYLNTSGYADVAVKTAGSRYR